MQQRMVNIIYTRVQYVYCLDYLKLTKGLAGIIQFLIEDMLNICLQKTFYAYYVFKFLITAFGKPTPNISPIPVRVNIKEVRTQTICTCTFFLLSMAGFLQKFCSFLYNWLSVLYLCSSVKQEYCHNKGRQYTVYKYLNCHDALP